MNCFKTLVLVAALTLPVQAQQASDPNRLYIPVTLEGTRQLIAGARRSVWMMAPTLGRLEIVQALALKAQSGVAVRLLLTNVRGVDPNALALSKRPNIDARWSPQQLGATAIVIDDLHLVLMVVGNPKNTPNSMEVLNRPEIAGSMRQRIEWIFQQSRRLR